MPTNPIGIGDDCNCSSIYQSYSTTTMTTGAEQISTLDRERLIRAAIEGICCLPFCLLDF